MLRTAGDKPTPIERWLVEEAKQGNGQALGTLFDVNILPVYRYALATLGDVRAAEQLTTAVFDQVAARLDSYGPGSPPFLSWLLLLAIVEMRRGRAGLGRRASIGYLGLTSITEEEADVLALRLAAGLSIEQTATAMGTRERHVRAAQHRAVSALSKAGRGPLPAQATTASAPTPVRAGT